MANIFKQDTNNTEHSRTFLDGSKRSVAILGSVAVGKGNYLPGWKWSLHAGPQTGAPSQRHIGLVISGQLVIKTAGGEECVVGPGEAFEVKPGHDAWVLGDKPCVAYDFEVLKPK